MQTIRVLFISLHNELRGYIGGGGFAFLDFLKRVRMKECFSFALLENAPTYGDAYGVEYDSVSFPASVTYEAYSGDRLPFVKTLDILEAIVKSVIVGVRTVKSRRIQAVISSNERIPNLIVAYLVGRLSHRPIIMMLHLLPGYEYALAAKRYPDFGFRSILSFQRAQHGNMGLGGTLHAFSKFMVSRIASRSICITNNSLFEPILKQRANYQQVYVCPLAGINVGEMDQIKEHSKKYDAIYVAGLISADKGIYDLLRAWKLVIKKDSGLILQIIGKCAPGVEERINEVVDRLGIRANVEIPFGLQGVAEKSIIFSSMKSSKVFVYPSIKDATPIVVMEALACGLPVVMYDAEYARGAYDESEFLRIVPVRDIDLLADETIRILESNAPELRARARRYAQRFENALVVNQELEVIRTIVRNSAKRIKDDLSNFS
jgi:glycosyltransferase involved in cell wall biosynthesis